MIMLFHNTSNRHLVRWNKKRPNHIGFGPLLSGLPPDNFATPPLMGHDIKGNPVEKKKNLYKYK